MPSTSHLRSQSRELRGGDMMTSCDCRRRNGLQYDCKRTGCQGRIVCLTKLYPKCCPSLFANRFETVTMGKNADPEEQNRIRVLNNGSCVVEYDPKIKPIHPENSKNPCGPKNPPCDKFWKQPTAQNQIQNETQNKHADNKSHHDPAQSSPHTCVLVCECELDLQTK